MVISASISAIIGFVCMLPGLPENSPKRGRAVMLAIALAALVLIVAYAKVMLDLIETPAS